MHVPGEVAAEPCPSEPQVHRKGIVEIFDIVPEEPRHEDRIARLDDTIVSPGVADKISLVAFTHVLDAHG